MIYAGNCRLGDLFESRRERGRPGLPLLSVTMNDGLVNRGELDRKQDSALAPEEHLLVKPGDIAYNMMRMWQGALGLADREGIVSPAYVILKPRLGVDPLYAFHLLKSPRVRYLLWAYSYGITDDRLRLYFDDFSKIPVTVPDLAVQQKIGRTLSSWDSAIEYAERLADLERANIDGVVKQVLVSSTLSSRVRRLGDCAEVFVSSVDKRYSAQEKVVRLCNYTDVYYGRHLGSEHSYEFGTASQSEIEKFQLRRGDVVITKDSEDPNDIGVAACILEAPDNLICGYHLAIVRPLPGELDGVLLQALFSLQSTRRHLFVQANGVTRFGLPVKAIESLGIALPEIDTQRRLSALLLASEARWKLHQRALMKMKEERCSLVQKLLDQKQVHPTSRLSHA